MIDGLYKIVIDRLGENLVGVAILTNGKLYGGGEVIHFSGNYTLDGEIISAKARTDIHDPTCNILQINMLRDASFTLTGPATGEQFTLSGNVKIPALGQTSQVTVTLTRLPSYAF